MDSSTYAPWKDGREMKIRNEKRGKSTKENQKTLTGAALSYMEGNPKEGFPSKSVPALYPRIPDRN